MDKRIIYCSQPFGFDAAMLAGILSQARRNNSRDGITGALISRHDVYFQLIEGPGAEIDQLYERILADDRHTNVKLLLQEAAPERMFPSWSMHDDEAPSMFWSSEDIVAGIAETASPAELLAPFTKLREKLANSLQSGSQ